VTAPVVSAQPLVAAIKAAVEAQGVPLGDGRKPADVGNEPWVVAWFDAGTVSDRTLRSRDGWSVVGVFRCCGLSPEAARVASRALRTALLGLHRATVDGRVLLMPENLASPPMTRDDDVSPPLFVQVDEWRFRTTPA
jgi:hypothetical protein